MSLKLNVITGTTRPGRVSPTIAAWFTKFAQENSEFEVELVDLADFELPLLDEAKHPRMQEYEHEHTKRWAQSVDSADAYVFVTPEYDYFPPAALVNAIQVLSKEWNYKAAGIVSYGFVSAGVRAAQPIRQLLSNLGAATIPQGVPIPFFPNFIGEEGTFSSNEIMEDGAKLMLDELYKWSNALKPLRTTA